MFYSKQLIKITNIKHCFFSKKGGTSTDLYKSLNCGIGSKDNKNKVKKNLEIVSRKLNIKKNNLITMKQTHSNKVIYIENKNQTKSKINCDAIVTKLKNLGISVLTADCVPILLYDPFNKTIGCIHSGWKGAYNGIIKNTIKVFLKNKSKKRDIIVSIGPCIKKSNYEVGLEFYKKFLKKSKKNKIFFSHFKNQTFFDLRKFVNHEISIAGIKKIDNLKMDTYSDSENFYSYRRSVKCGEKDYGRCISVILMT